MSQWASDYPLILAAALVGSQARGTARPDSDIDLMFLTEQPLFFKTSVDWLSKIDWGNCDIERWEDKEYGAVWSRHVFLKANTGHLEIELSFGLPDWASTAPLDPGTQQVVCNGCRILHDPEERLSQLMQFFSQPS